MSKKQHNTSLKNFKIGELWTKPSGSLISYAFHEPANFHDPSIIPKENFTVEIDLLKLKNSITAVVKNFYLPVEFNCGKCLESFTYNIEFNSVEGEYVYDLTETNYDPHEFLPINRQELTIDLQELLRQEIILHFPIIPLCFSGCKGICQQCGKNLNNFKEHPTECGAITTESNKPFANLKQLYEESK